jgi:predicted dehydrogenase
MSEQRSAGGSKTSRRSFLKTTALAGGTALVANLTFLPNVHAAGSDKIKVGLIGCGGRGSGAADDVLHAAAGVEIIALGDVFKFRAHGLRRGLEETAKNNEDVKRLGNTVNVPDERCFVGLNAYQEVINSGADYIILATPPGFRPIHLEAAVAASKNIFTEKPVGTDAPGIRKVLDAAEKAAQKKLCIVAGTQRRHQTSYLEVMKRVKEGAIGDIRALRCYWNQGNIWFRQRDDLKKLGVTDSDLAYELYNWYHFVWICGDHIVEQHVHNLDVCNWAMGTHPIRAVGMGGRQALPHGNPDVNGNIFDHFAVDYEYPNGVHMMSMCRQIDGCEPNISEALVGTKGTSITDDARRHYEIKAARPYKFPRGSDNRPYVQEHTDLINSIRTGKPVNELRQVAESTMTAILGRMSTYTGKALSWDEALASKEVLMPDKLNFKDHISVPASPMPGQARG